MQLIDLHVHSTASDGTLTPTEVTKLGFHEAELPLDDAKRVLHPGTDAGFHVFDVDGRFVLARMLLQGFYLAGTLGDQPVHIHLGQLLALWRSLVAGIG